MTTPPKCPSRLGSRWVFWHDKWEVRDGRTLQSLIDLGEADTARSFWQMFQSNPVEQLQEGSSLHVFKGSVKPEWEDPANIHGGHFRFTPLPDQPNASPSKLWYNLVLGAIGGHFTLTSSIVGVGFTSKKGRKVVAVWVNTTDPSAIRNLQSELSQHTSERFVSKFITHQELPRSDFMAQEAVWHRRTKSAPSQYVSIDDDDDTGSEVSGGVAAAAAGGGAIKRRAAPMPLDSAFANDTGSVADHLRSKSEGVSRDVVPNLHNLSSAQHGIPSAARTPATAGPSALPSTVKQSPPAPVGTAAPAGVVGRSPGHAVSPGANTSVPGVAIERADTEFNWQDSRELRDSGGSGVYPCAKAPTPMNDWGSDWSPSLLNAALAKRPALDNVSSTTSPGTAQGDAGHAAQMQFLQAANAQHHAAQHQHQQQQHHQDSPMNLSSTQPSGSPPQAQQPPQPFGSFPIRVGQQPQPQVQQAPQPHLAPGSAVIHNPYQLQHATQPYTQQPTYCPPPASHLSPAGAAPLPYVIVRQPVSHTAPPTSASQDPAMNRSRPKNTAPERAPFRQGAAQPSSKSPPPRPSVGPGTGPSGPAFRESPPPQSRSPPPGTSTSPGDRRANHTKSDAPAFLFQGWMYPGGLNRKERRRIMFSDEVKPGDYPGAKFIAEGLPDGPCTDEGVPMEEGSAQA